MMKKLKYCRCTHEWEAHQHYRNDTDCSFCGRDRCPAFRRESLFSRLMHKR